MTGPGADPGAAGGEAVRRSAGATRLVRSDELAVEAQDDTHVTVFHHGSAARWKVSRSVYRFLLAFDTPHTLAEVAGGEPAPALLAQVDRLRARGMLVDADAPPPADHAPPRTAVAYRFAGAPACSRDASAADCVVLGVPYDLGDTVDCRLAPAAIRQKSLDYTYEIAFSNGRPRGWFAADRGQRILEGITIADAGDVRVEYGENQRELFARIERVLDEVAPPGSVPVLLGGDRSVTWAALDHARRRGPLSLVQLAARPAVEDGAAEGFVTADGVVAQVARLPGVEAALAVGGLQGDAHGEESETGAILWSAAFARAAGPTALARRLGHDRAVHLSIDMSATTRDYARPQPRGAGGLTLAEIAEAVRAIGADHRIVAIDLVGLDLQRREAPVSIAVACHLVLCAMSAACDRGRSRS
jgi:agmatinase